MYGYNFLKKLVLKNMRRKGFKRSPLKSVASQIKIRKSFRFEKICEGRDLNPRTPTRLDPQSSAFNQAWQPSLHDLK